MRLAAASGAGDADTAARSFEALSGSGRISGPDKLRMIESIAGSYYRAQQYAKAMQWSQRYLREGGTSPRDPHDADPEPVPERRLRRRDQGADGRDPGRRARRQRRRAEDRLKLLLNAASKQGDNNAYVFAMEKLVTYYPKKEYWVDLLSRMQRKPNFSDRLSLDAYRLSLATGSMSAPADYMEMAQLALQADLASEGKQVIDKGIEQRCARHRRPGRARQAPAGAGRQEARRGSRVARRRRAPGRRRQERRRAGRRSA